jgi:hypothetical protein
MHSTSWRRRCRRASWAATLSALPQPPSDPARPTNGPS